jgi:hypothetical protein
MEAEDADTKEVIMATLYDKVGRVVAPPICHKCQKPKNIVLGGDSFAWICNNEECHEPKDI